MSMSKPFSYLATEWPNPSINTDAGNKAAGAGYVKR
jgi:hypothetical protein